MLMQTTTQLAPIDPGIGQPIPRTPPSAPTPQIESGAPIDVEGSPDAAAHGVVAPSEDRAPTTARATPSAPAWRWLVKGFVLVLILISIVGFCGFLLGMQLPGLPGHAKDESINKDKKD